MKNILLILLLLVLAPLSIKAQAVDSIVMRANLVDMSIANFKNNNITARFIKSCDECFSVTDMPLDTTNVIEKLALYKKRVLIQADMLVFSKEKLADLKKVNVNSEATIQQLQKEIDERVLRQNRLRVEFANKKKE